METIYYWVKVLVLLWICMLFFIFASSGNKSHQRDGFSKYIIMVTLSVVFPVILYSRDVGKIGFGIGFGEFSWGFPFVSYFGFFLIFLGVVIHWIGILTLKEQWSLEVVISDNHKLVDTGIYRVIRHPIYAALLLEILGFGLALANWISILILLVPNVASLAYRIYVEEKVLERHFGSDYLNYERRTKRLIPGIF